MSPKRFFATALLLSGFGFQVQAAPLSATETMQQFNLIVFGSASSSSHVDGRTYVGGSLSGGDYGQHLGRMPASPYAGLTVGGSAANVNVNGGGISVGGSLASGNINNGSAYVGGSVANTNFNGGGAYVGGSAANVNFNRGRLSDAPAQSAPEGIEANMRDLSRELSQLSATGSTVAFDGNRAVFNAVAGADGIAVFDLSGIDADVFRKGEFLFNTNGADLLVFNVDELLLDFSANFLGGSAQGIGSRAVWNFYNASNLTIRNQFGGSVLAPNASFTNYNNIEGTVVVSSLNQRGEVHLQPLNASLPSARAPLVPPANAVPEPGSFALLLAALGALAVFRRAAARPREAHAG
ncbi:choice-of-anchor A family protein [Thauera linaloolentis]|uniref:Uncharacterized protein n=1 Tax=Thauera linaloolentis (strain DSM 12138 / JCM 21573 / CCUG 41526 / CIP 105981 / IAM 15112 / NBRC 102519 / 47Lol) TaxID=1123367 RepID=N6YFY1_THAL4|nr:choice-of-anchor A family protein [Thauera linaloolentis]ENO90385.1 hypothetical protein C666_01885 [Thauera linaloolentis 47Lol = DSM 12138]MCM8564040.1 choice-of-anchor A family protein [Thauera linaloolentis]